MNLPGNTQLPPLPAEHLDTVIITTESVFTGYKRTRVGTREIPVRQERGGNPNKGHQPRDQGPRKAVGSPSLKILKTQLPGYCALILRNAEPQRPGREGHKKGTESCPRRWDLIHALQSSTLIFLHSCHNFRMLTQGKNWIDFIF